MNISWIDVSVIVVYLVGITTYGIGVGFRRRTSSDQYFLAGKSLGWFTIGAAVFTSNISTLHLVGLAAGGAKDGMVIGNFEWMACFTLVLLALIFAPFYITSKVHTLPEFMERRYCPAARTFLACIGLLGALLIHIGISLFAAAKVFESFLGVPMYATIIVLSVFTVTYTALGGLKAVVMTENVQVFLLLAGAIMVTVLGLQALPAAGVHDIAGFKAAVMPGQLHMLQPVINAHGQLNEFSWLGVILGYPILGIWYWCADQTHVQRVLGAESLQAGQNGALFAGFLKITPVFLMVFPSCMAAALNSCATLISMDIVKRSRPDTPDARVVMIGRITTGLIMILAMLWSTQGDQFGTIFEAINKIPMTFAPAVTTVFVLGVMWKRGTKQAAMATLYVGSIIGAIYFVFDLPKIGKLMLGSGSVPEGFGGLVSDPVHGLGIPFMLIGPLLAVVCVVIYVVTSLLTPAMDPQEVAKVCWNHPLDFLKGRLLGVRDPRIVALILLASVGVLYYQLR